MSIDLLGSWEGTLSTGDDTVFPGLLDLNGKPVNQGTGGPTRTYNVTLEIEWQGDFEQFSYGYNFTASPFYGVLAGEDPISGGHRLPVSGFVNPEGFISFSFYTDKKPAPPNVIQVTQHWNFEAFIQTHGGFHTMSGEWLITGWQDHFISYRYGNLNVKRKVLFSERTSFIAKIMTKIFK